MRRGLSVVVIDQIHLLQSQGRPIRKIAAILGITRNSVRKYLRENDEALPQRVPSKALKGSWKEQVPWQEVLKKRAAGYQVDFLHREYAGEIASYWSFNRAIHKLLSALPEKVVIPQVHKPGEKTQIDYTDGVKIYDRKTGLGKKTQLFCGVLAHSGYCFGEFSMDQKQATFLRSQERMWHFFSGVTPYVVPDNLKTGVKKAHIYDPEVNPTYCDFANHYGFAVLPARPRRPRDKGTIEATIGALQRSFFQEVRDIKFYSLDDLNVAFARFLKDFNNRIMKDYGVSRADRFQSEKDLLLPLPRLSFQLLSWHQAKVHPDCHIQIEQCYYSVPFQYVGQIVRVKKSENSIEIFSQDMEPLALHPRLKIKGTRSMQDAHFPEQRLQASRFEVKQAMARSEAIGPRMLELMEKIFATPRPLVGLRKAQGILRAWGKDGIGNEAMEYAAGQCLTFAKYRVDFFRDCALAFQKRLGHATHQAPKRCLEQIFLTKD